MANEIKNLKQKNFSYEKRINELENVINELKKRINILERKYEQKFTNLFNSKIDIDENLVKTWLNNRQFKATLLYRMSEDGDSYSSFHKKCDNTGFTITFIETTNGMKFGGYTELNWDVSQKDKTDDTTFLFNFNFREKYIKNNNSYSIGCYSDDGPKFGWGPQIGFNNLKSKGLKIGWSVKSKDNPFALKESFYFNLEKDNNSNINYYFKTKELEVYQIKYF